MAIQKLIKELSYDVHHKIIVIFKNSPQQYLTYTQFMLFY